LVLVCNRSHALVEAVGAEHDVCQIKYRDGYTFRIFSPKHARNVPWMLQNKLTRCSYSGDIV